MAKNCRRQQPHSHLMPPQRGTLCEYPHTPFPETSHWPRFLSLTVWVYLHSNMCSGLQKTHRFCNRVRFGRSRSYKIDNFGTNRKRVCDFYISLPLWLWSYLAPFLRYSDFLAKNFLFLLTSLIRCPCSIWSHWHSASVWQTDRRIDGRTDLL